MSTSGKNANEYAFDHEKYYNSYLYRERLDLLVSVFLMVGAWLIAIWFDLFEFLYDFTREYEDFEVDEILTLCLISPIFAAVFTGRRMFDLRHHITHAIRTEHRISHMAFHDSLTGLPNRMYLHQYLEAVLGRIKQDHNSVAVLMIDLDRFKEVNDIFGHSAGDDLLKMVSDRIVSIARPSEIAVRFGGDEFIVIQSEVKQPDGAAELAERILNSLAQPFEITGHEIRVGASIGIAVGRGWVRTAEDLIRSADMAVYRVKATGKNSFSFFEPEMEQHLYKRRETEHAMRTALQEENFTLYYQPIVSLETPRDLIGFEALLRWRHPERGIIPPGEFIPLAEETGLIIDIGRWVIRTACMTAASWQPPAKIAINVSPVQFRQGNILEDVEKALAESGLDPERLQVEITENSLMEDPDAAMTTLLALRRQGVQIVMDDFGTGYSSLGYLRTFPFDKIKIDRSFVKGAITSAEDKAIVKAVIDIGRAMGLQTTGEGAETERTLALLMKEGCAEAQGFYLGVPSEKPDFETDYAARARAAVTECEDRSEDVTVNSAECL